jgi:predicted RNA-binding Zn ribbon-like protein
MKLSAKYQAPGELALLYDFVNSLDMRTYVERGKAHSPGDEIGTPRQLESWMRARRLRGRASRAVHEQALNLRTALRTFLRMRPEERAGSSTAVDDLNAASEAFPLVVNLADAEVTLQPVEGTSGLGQVMAQFHTLAATQQLDRLKMCASDECGWIFFDQSKPANRRWCSSTRCGNRSKTRSYRERRRINEGVSPRTRSRGRS